MNPIQFPLYPESKGPEVNNLHKAIMSLGSRIKSDALTREINDQEFMKNFFREAEAQYYGEATKRIVSLFQQQYMMMEGTGAVDEATAREINKLLAKDGLIAKEEEEILYMVSGTVRGQFMDPLVKVPVRIFDQDIRDEQFLGEAYTDENGKYEIRYFQDKFGITDLLYADIIVRVYDRNNTLLKSSETFFNAPPQLVVDFDLSNRVYKGPSEYEVVIDSIKPYIGELTFDQLTENKDFHDITFLTRKTFLDEERITDLAIASRFERQTKLQATVFYGILREGLPDDFVFYLSDNMPSPVDLDKKEQSTYDSLMQAGLEKLVTAVKAAINDNIIPYRLLEEMDRIKDQLAKLVDEYNATHKIGIRRKAELASLSDHQKKVLQELVESSSGVNNTFWNVLRQNNGFTSENVELIHAIFQLSDLAKEHLPLVEQIMQSENIKSPKDLQTFAAYDIHDWEEFLNHKKVPTFGFDRERDKDASMKSYAKILAQNFEKAFPSIAFSARFQRDSSLKIQQKDKLNEFFKNNPEFDLHHTPVSAYLKKDSAKVQSSDVAELEEPLKKIQRVFKIAPTFKSTQTLLNDNIHSSKQVYFQGKKNFVKRYSEVLGTKEAVDIYRRAELQYGGALALTTELRSLATAGNLGVMPNYHETLQQSILADEFPSLQTLFGKADFCECEECRSVYGAPAYLTDVLHFLSERVSVDPGKSAKDVMFNRRPDIGDIDLNCSNTNTLVPYIDMSNEVMEDSIAVPSFHINLGLLPSIKKGKIDGLLLNDLLTNPSNIAISSINLLTANAEVSDLFTTTEFTFNQWIVRDKYITLKLTQLPSSIEVKLLHQTHLTADEISANPEYTNVLAYTTLANAKRPFSLPFDLFEKEGELYLEKLGIKKNDLIDYFRQFHETITPPDDYVPSDYQRAYAYFGLNHAEQSLIFSEDIPNQNTYWGNTATVGEVDLFQKATSLSYNEVTALIALPFINPTLDTTIVSDDLSCDCNKKNISHLGNDKLDRIHRFLRFWKKTDLTLQELDACIRAKQLGNGKLDKNFAVRMERFMLLRSKLELSVAQLLSFYQNIDISNANSLYYQLFLNKAIINPLNPDFKVEKVTSATPSTVNATDISLMLAVFGISPEELNLLLGKTDNKLSLDNLSFLYRNVLLAQGLSLEVSEFLTVLELLNMDPFKDPVETMSFLQKYNSLKTSGFTIEELNYVLTHRDEEQAFIPTDSTIVKDLTSVRSGLQLIRAATSVLPDPKGELLSKWLGDGLLNWHPGIVTKLVDILGTVDDTEYQQKISDNKAFLKKLRIKYDAPFNQVSLFTLPAAITTFPDNSLAQISYDADKRVLTFLGYMSLDDKNDLLALSGDTDYQKAINDLYDLAQKNDSSPANVLFANDSEVDSNLGALNSTQIPARFAFFLNKIAPAYKDLMENNFIKQQVNNLFKVDKAVAEQLLMLIPLIKSDFTSDPFVNTNKEISNANYPSQFRTYLIVSKIAFVINKLKIPAEDLSFLLQNAAQIHTLDFMTLPVTPLAPPITTFKSFENLVNLYKLEHYFPEVKNIDGEVIGSLFSFLQEVIDGKPLNDLEDALILLTGWSRTELHDLLTTNPLTLQLTSDLKDIDVLMRLYKMFAMSGNLGTTLASCIAWTTDSLSFQQSQDIKNTLKSKYDDSSWVEVSKPLQDKLREAKRDALVTFLLANPGSNSWNDPNDLFAHFLIDVEMCACQPSSRIVQANNSVQLFVQRCLMNLEDKVAANAEVDEDWLQWKWMQNYRLWEANRQVFLYPENWIEPELRLVKSSFFKDLENDLLQNDVTKENAETAFMNYLEKLDGVARLEVKGMWYQDDASTLHVFARTYGGDPHIYYYRKFQDNRRWTPWEKVDLDIKSDHLIPVVYNKRVYLFWPVFTEKAYDVDTVSIPHPGDTYSVQQPQKYWQVQLAFSEYKNGKWSPKKISVDMIDQIDMYPTGDPEKPYNPDKSDFVFIPLDFPDLSNLFKPDGEVPKDFSEKLVEDLTKNGTIVINCYVSDLEEPYYSFKGTFELDPCRGYPVRRKSVYAKPNLHLFDRSGWQNMLDTENVSYDDPADDALSLSSNEILKDTPDVFRNLIPLQMGFFDKLVYAVYYLQAKSQPNISVEGQYREGFKTPVGTFMPYFYQDKGRTFYVSPEISDNNSFEFFYSDLEELLVAVFQKNTTKVQEILAEIPQDKKSLKMMYHFYPFYHPFTCFFIRQLFSKGIEGFMSRDTQLKGDLAYDPQPVFDFDTVYEPNAPVVYSGKPVTYDNGVTDNHPGYPKEDVDFNLRDGYAFYNWELFFHAPLMIAERLSQNKQFEEATRWFNFIFNPTDTSAYTSPQKFWITKPFFKTTKDTYLKERIEQIMLLTDRDPDAGEKKQLVDNVKDWRKNPFLPHNIAEYRTVAYQKTVVMKYVDHLIAWGDQLFRQDTMESVNQATQLYVLASDILGPRPQVIPPSYELPVQNFYQLEKNLDAFSNAMVDIENLLPLQEVKGYNGVEPSDPKFPRLETLYFCIPMNDKLMGYWDTVEDRLYKIRHCLNIEGVFAPLALFAPPIDPGMLVRAAAAGLDIGAILSDLNAPMPVYKFNVTLQKANELCNDVKALGAALLSALEKKDAESLSLLRADQEIKVLQAVKLVRDKQLADANAAVDTLKASIQQTQIKIDYYSRLINEGINAYETTALALNTASTVIDAAIAIGYALSGGLKLIPAFTIGAAGFGGSPTGHVQTGGNSFGSSAEDAVKTMSAIATGLDKVAGLATTMSTYERRKQEWEQQLRLANQELEQLNMQMVGTKIRVDIATQEVSNQELQIDNSEKVNEFLRSKFTNVDLYNYMITQISAVYFQSYQKAYDLAKRAEHCFQYELGLPSSSYINFGYWDSLKKGLLSGERLMLDLRKLDIAYQEQNKREYELSKNISIALLDPVALLKLKENGECWINLPEELFDIDHPGQYFRRIKTVSLSIPCVAGPYTTVSCTLTLTKNSIRTNSTATGATAYPRKKNSAGLPADDKRFRDNLASVQSVAISTGQNDTGLFELNFRDDRYLPFEGAGAISTWHLQLPSKFRQFDYDSISDVIMHVKYTAREGGDVLKSDAETSLQTTLKNMLTSPGQKGLYRMFSARYEFPTEWYNFLHPAVPGSDQILEMDITDRFPYFLKDLAIKITKVEVFMEADSSIASVSTLSIIDPGALETNVPLSVDPNFNSLLHGSHTIGNKDKGKWKVKNTAAGLLTAAQVKDLIVVFYYQV